MLEGLDSIGVSVTVSNETPVVVTLAAVLPAVSWYENCTLYTPPLTRSVAGVTDAIPAREDGARLSLSMVISCVAAVKTESASTITRAAALSTAPPVLVMVTVAVPGAAGSVSVYLSVKFCNTDDDAPGRAKEGASVDVSKRTVIASCEAALPAMSRYSIVRMYLAPLTSGVAGATDTLLDKARKKEKKNDAWNSSEIQLHCCSSTLMKCILHALTYTDALSEAKLANEPIEKECCAAVSPASKSTRFAAESTAASMD